MNYPGNIGDRVYAVARSGGPWYVRECEIGGLSWIGPGANVLFPVSDGRADRSLRFSASAETALTRNRQNVFRSREEAQAEADARQDTHERLSDMGARAKSQAAEARQARQARQREIREAGTCPDCKLRSRHYAVMQAVQAAIDDRDDEAAGAAGREEAAVAEMVAAIEPLGILSHDEFECPTCGNIIVIPDV